MKLRLVDRIGSSKEVRPTLSSPAAECNSPNQSVGLSRGCRDFLDFRDKAQPDLLVEVDKAAQSVGTAEVVFTAE